MRKGSLFWNCTIKSVNMNRKLASISTTNSFFSTSFAQSFSFTHTWRIVTFLSDRSPFSGHLYNWPSANQTRRCSSSTVRTAATVLDKGHEVHSPCLSLVQKNNLTQTHPSRGASPFLCLPWSEAFSQSAFFSQQRKV